MLLPPSHLLTYVSSATDSCIKDWVVKSICLSWHVACPFLNPGSTQDVDLHHNGGVHAGHDVFVAAMGMWTRMMVTMTMMMMMMSRNDYQDEAE